MFKGTPFRDHRLPVTDCISSLGGEKDGLKKTPLKRGVRQWRREDELTNEPRKEGAPYKRLRRAAVGVHSYLEMGKRIHGEDLRKISRVITTKSVQ